MKLTSAIVILMLAVPTTVVCQVSPVSKSFDNHLQKIKKQYRLGEISDQAAWQKLSQLLDAAEKNKESLNLSELYQTQSKLLEKARYPILSAKYAAMALATSKDPFAKDLTPSWDQLDLVSSKSQIHDILIDLAGKLNKSDKAPPVFKKNWFYFLGEAHLAAGEVDKAIALFSKLDPKDRYYYAARYQLAMTYLHSKEDLTKSALILRTIASDEIANIDGVSPRTRSQYVDQANLALARIQYERQKFISSIKYFRKVKRTSTFYYDALFGQSWAFFLAGYPNHALGALHAVESPYFPGRFNPESSVLRSLIYYWMCLYDDSKTSLADFVDRYSEPVNNLDSWLTRRSLTAEKSFDLFENLISGVSSKSLGIDRNLLESAAISPDMIFARERLATVLSERDRLKKRGIFQNKKNTQVPTKILDEWIKQISLELGRIYLAELERVRDEFKNLRSQSNFIYIELLMSEKEQVLGKELHSDQKLDQVNFSKKVKGWGQGNMPWKASDKGEYWWDEVGFFVYQVAPQCNTEQAGK